MKKQIELSLFRSSEIKVLAKWLAQGHVKLWYPEPDANIEWARKPPEDAGHYLIEVNNESVGYIRWQIVSRETLDDIGLHQVPGNSADVDILIGEQSRISKGVGPIALNLLAEKLKARGDIPTIGLTSAKENIYAHAAFRKAGYVETAEYVPDGYGRCILFTLNL